MSKRVREEEEERKRGSEEREQESKREIARGTKAHRKVIAELLTSKCRAIAGGI